MNDVRELGRAAPRDPYEGVTLFDSYDTPQFSAEEGQLGVTDWHRVELYQSGYTRVITRAAGESRPAMIEQDLRTGHDFGNGPREQVEARLAQGRALLTRHGVDLEQYPTGYPEVDEILEGVLGRPPLRMEHLEPGKRYLYVRTDSEYDKDRPFVTQYIFRHDYVGAPIRTTRYFTGVHYTPDPLLGKERGVIQLLPGTPGPMEPFSSLDGGAFGPQALTIVPVEESPYDKHEFYAVTEDEATIVGALRKPHLDPNVGSDFDRERTCVHAALMGLQYSRWPVYEAGAIGDSGSRQAYAEALGELIDRFGEGPVTDEMKLIMTAHLHTLHTQTHMPTSPYKPHSDGTPYGKEIMDVARTVTGNTHPIARNMRDTGNWVNFLSLFGDPDFWAVTRERYPGAFNQAVDHLLGLPRDFKQKSIYLTHKVTIDPIALIRDHYPQAYAEIVQARPDFAADDGVAMRVLFTQDEIGGSRGSTASLERTVIDGETLYRLER